MTRHKHNKSAKVHFPVTVRIRGKPDSAYVECSCGFDELVATWYDQEKGGDWTDRWGRPVAQGKVADIVVAFLEPFQYPLNHWEVK